MSFFRFLIVMAVPIVATSLLATGHLVATGRKKDAASVPSSSQLKPAASVR